MRGSDAEMVERARLGDEAAFAALVERHWLRLVALARSVAGDDEAEDAVQEAFLTAWSKLGALRRPEAFAAWMMRGVVRRCLRRAHRRRRLVPLADAPEPAAHTDAGGELDVERVLAWLAPRQRAVMHLTVLEGMSDSEIGAALGIRPASVRAHRRRARERLRPILGATSGGSER